MLAGDVQEGAEKQGLLSFALSGCCTNTIRPSEAKRKEEGTSLCLKKKKRKSDRERRRDRERVRYLHLSVPIT